MRRGGNGAWEIGLQDHSSFLLSGCHMVTVSESVLSFIMRIAYLAIRFFQARRITNGLEGQYNFHCG